MFKRRQKKRKNDQRTDKIYRTELCISPQIFKTHIKYK